MTVSEYEIRTLEDFLKVPADRLPECLRDFGDWLALARRKGEVDKILTEAVGVETDLAMDFFHWIDDGQRGVSEVSMIDRDTGQVVARAPR